jgi:hypothetical protein
LEFEQKKASDKTFASDPDTQLNWFYSKSPYWDSSLNLYPVGSIVSEKELIKLKQ